MFFSWCPYPRGEGGAWRRCFVPDTKSCVCFSHGLCLLALVRSLDMKDCSSPFSVRQRHGNWKAVYFSCRNLLWSFFLLPYGVQRYWENTSHTQGSLAMPHNGSQQNTQWMELYVCWRGASWLQPDPKWALIVLWLFLVALNLVEHCKLALWWKWYLKNGYRFKFNSSIAAVLLPLTYFGAICEYLLGWLCPAQMFPETGDDLKMKDSSEESEKAFSGFFFLCVCVKICFI